MFPFDPHKNAKTPKVIWNFHGDSEEKIDKKMVKAIISLFFDLSCILFVELISSYYSKVQIKIQFNFGILQGLFKWSITIWYSCNTR